MTALMLKVWVFYRDLALQTMSVECPPGVVAGHVEQALSIFTPTYIIKVSSTRGGNKTSRYFSQYSKNSPSGD